MGGESEEEEAGEEEEMTGEEEAGEDEFNLEEILAELDSLNENEEVEEAMQEPSDSAAAGAAELERMIKALAAKMGTSFDAAYDKIGNIIHGGKSLGVREVAQENEELEEAMSTISTLRSELNEVNLLNAKLLYVNKLFKSKNLTEAQKVKVINAFDRAETVKETKNIFETLQESLNVTPAKNSIKESLSYASKAAGVAPNRQPIVENNDFVARMQKLAGII
jgi:succinate dehydrogenase/fumarate reductase flavoprotein subunit